ncbi:MAG: hypothetical protein HY897_07940 [Deltaproteobacteria bacterium]|nr:hypothetical protein [Deltaproteobacteria bacterium]
MRRTVSAVVAFGLVLGAAPALADVGLAVGGGSMVVPDRSYDPFSQNDNLGVGMLSIRAAPFRKGVLAGLGFEAAYAGGTASDAVWGEFDTNLTLNILSFGPSYRREVTDWFVPYGRLLLSVAWGDVGVKSTADNAVDDSATAFGGSLALGFELLMPRRVLYPDTGRKDAWYKPDNFGVFFEAGYGIYDALVFSRANVPEIEGEGAGKASYRPAGPALGSLSLSGPTIRTGFVANF